MTDQVTDGLIAIYDDVDHAILDFQSLVDFDSNVAVDAAVAERDEFLKVSNEALDNGEGLLAIICPPSETERFDRLLIDARSVLQVDVAELPD